MPFVNQRGIRMATTHAASGELIDLRPFGPALRQAATETLVRAEHLEIFRLILLGGRSLPGHQHARAVTIQCLEGAIELTVGGSTQPMRAGSMVYVAGGVPHTLTAIDDAALLVTLVVDRE
ncbi:MAG: cupin domain-containing protein [Casimicrobiaceae bacterium]